MTFQITEVVDSQSDHVLAKAIHQCNAVPVTIRGMKDHSVPLGEPFQAEISFDEILDWKTVSDFDDAKSGIWQEQDGIHLLGRVHSILDYGDGAIVIDIYLQNGPEFFTVNLNATDEEAPGANEGLEIIIKTLFLVPVS